MFGLSDISGRFGLGRVWFGSDRFRVNQFLMKYARHAKTSNFVENFGSGMGPGHSVRVSGLGSVLSGLPYTHQYLVFQLDQMGYLVWF